MSIRQPGQIPYNLLVGRVIRWHRERLGWDQTKIANELGIFQPAYSRIELGGTSITVAQFRIIARALRMRPSDLLRQVEDWAQQLKGQGVTVIDAKEVPKAALAIGAGVLTALLIAAASSS
jgi:transcriptional regulator with XRE-family HTH domain